MHIDISYIPTVQVWGDGRIIWVEYNSEGDRMVWEGSLTHNEMTQLVIRLTRINFFRFGFGNEKYCVGEYLTVKLSTITSRRRVNSDNINFSKVYSFLKTGGGVMGKEFIPETGNLYAYPIEEMDYLSDSEAKCYWPDDKFGYTLEKIRTQNNGKSISGEELRFAWEVVNREISAVMSNGKMYWIEIEVPGVSP